MNWESIILQEEQDEYLYFLEEKLQWEKENAIEESASDQPS